MSFSFVTYISWDNSYLGCFTIVDLFFASVRRHIFVIIVVVGNYLSACVSLWWWVVRGGS